MLSSYVKEGSKSPKTPPRRKPSLQDVNANSVSSSGSYEDYTLYDLDKVQGLLASSSRGGEMC